MFPEPANAEHLLLKMVENPSEPSFQPFLLRLAVLVRSDHRCESCFIRMATRSGFFGKLFAENGGAAADRALQRAETRSKPRDDLLKRGASCMLLEPDPTVTFRTLFGRA